MGCLRYVVLVFAFLDFAGCGHPLARSTAGVAAPQPIAPPSRPTEPPPLASSWIGSVTEPGAARVVPSSFCAEDRRYCALVPARPIAGLRELWTAEARPIHEYEISVRTTDAADTSAMATGLRSLGRIVTEDGTLRTTAGEPRVLVIPATPMSQLRMIVTFPRRADHAAFVAFLDALPGLREVRTSLGLDEPPRAAQLNASYDDGQPWYVEATWSLDEAAADRVRAVLASPSYVRRDDGSDEGWRRMDGERRIDVTIDPTPGGPEVTVSIAHHW